MALDADQMDRVEALKHAKVVVFGSTGAFSASPGVQIPQYRLTDVYDMSFYILTGRRPTGELIEVTDASGVQVRVDQS